MRTCIFLLYILLLSCTAYSNPDTLNTGYCLEGSIVKQDTIAHESFKRSQNTSSANLIPYTTQKILFSGSINGKKEEKREDEVASPIENFKNGSFTTAFFYASLWKSLLQQVELFLLNHDFHTVSYRKHILLQIFRI